MHSQLPLSGIIKFVFMSLFCGFLLSACDSTSSRELPESVDDTTAPGVLRITPESETTGYEVDYLPTVLFSEQVNIESVFDGNVKVFSGQFGVDSNEEPAEREASVTYSTVPGEKKIPDEASGKLLNVDATELTVSLASGRFALNNIYTLQIGEGIHDLVDDDLSTSEDERNFLSGSQSTAFTTESGLWGDSSSLNLKYLNTDGASVGIHASESYDPIVRSNDRGDVLLVWRQLVDGYTQIWASQYLVDEEVWVVPGVDSISRECLKDSASSKVECLNSVRLDQVDSSSAYSPDISLNEAGQFAVTWVQEGAASPGRSVWVNIFDGAVWSGAADILAESRGASVAAHPVVSLSDAGNVTCAWLEEKDGVNSVRATTFKFNDIGFGAPIDIDAQIDAEDIGMAFDLSLDIASNGSGLVVWSQVVKGIDRIRTKTFSEDQTDSIIWGATTFVDSVVLDLHSAIEPKVSIAGNGDIAVVWRQSNGAQYDLYFNRFAGNAWQAPEKIENDDSGDVSEASLDYNNLGKLFVAWSVVYSESEYSLKVRSYHHDEGWSSIEDISISAVGSEQVVSNPVITFDYEGNGSLLWAQNTSINPKVVARQYSKISKVWLGENTIFTNVTAGESSSLNQQTLMLDGRLLSVWAWVTGTESSLLGSLFREELAELD